MNNLPANIQSILNIDLFSLFELSESFNQVIIAYLVGIFFIYLIFILIRYLISRLLRNNDLIKNRIGNFLNLAVVFTIILFGLSLFSKNASTILAISGIFSAALVVALQDFVSSFFAWVFIMSREKYRVGDIIKLAGTHSYIYGKVTKIELFRTMLEERMGDGDFNGNMNKEMPTGRTVSVPNNMVMRGAVMNFTLENRALWHSYTFTITFDSDFELAEKIMKIILSGVFDNNYYKANKIPLSYKPYLSMYIAENGVNFSIWFPAYVGKFREVLNNLCRKILFEFRDNKINLAFNTITLHKPEDQNLPV